MPKLKDKYLTISEAAKEVSVTRQTISRWIKQGTLDAEKIGRETLIEKKRLETMRRARFVETFDEAIMTGFIDDIMKEGKYSKDDTITHIGNLVFDVKKKDGTHEIADIVEFTVEANQIEFKTYKEYKKKGKG